MFEIKLNDIFKTDDTITLTARLYRMVGPISLGIGPGGREYFYYTRTLLITRSYTLNRPISRDTIIAYLRQKMEDYNTAHGTEFTPADFYVNITEGATGLGAS